jgi:hypothetical protein
VPDIENYSTAAGVEAAIKDAAKKASATDPSLNTNERIRLEHFNRFLSRIFSKGDNSEWVLKGGTGVLARVPSGRATRDVDLYHYGHTLNDALTDLRRLAAIDLGDHFAFEYVKHEEAIGGADQPYLEGYRVTFETSIGGQTRGRLNVDLSIGVGATAEVTTVKPATALALPRLVSHEYRLYPVVDQIADKVCATMTEYKERAPSREKDLVDLVIFATTHDIDGTALRIAIVTESRRRHIDPFGAFTVPTAWGLAYSRLSKQVPHCADYPTVELASALAKRLIDPALAGETDGRTWSHTSLRWT